MSFEVIVLLGFAVVAVVAYLLGSISFAVIFSTAFTKKDVRDEGSGNAGMTNVLRTAGALPGVLTCVGDFGKAALSAVFGMYIAVPYLNTFAPSGMALLPVYGGIIGAIFCMLGHVFPLFFQFRGGKGIMAAIGAITIIDWRIACMLLAVFFIVLIFTKIVSASSIVAAASYPIATFFMSYFMSRELATGNIHIFGLPAWAFETAGAVIMAVITISKHSGNIKRLIRGEEKSLKVKK